MSYSINLRLIKDECSNSISLNRIKDLSDDEDN